ncbi:MAG: flagellar biosynthetic protein FliQ [Neomegalonema sp.]|nr:flagellar biosynthetic protein FliQ [Neomegalonema sp.]
MKDAEILSMLRESIWVAVGMSTPMLAAALIVGLTIGVLQALTSIQELTLTFVPKIAALGAVLWMSLDYMGRTIVGMFQNTIIPTIAGG